MRRREQASTLNHLPLTDFRCHIAVSKEMLTPNPISMCVSCCRVLSIRGAIAHFSVKTSKPLTHLISTSYWR